MAKAAKATKEIPVVVTTTHRGVFFGFVPEGADLTQKTVRLTQAQMCVYWSSDVRGVLGLAATGPRKGCKIGPAIPALTLQDVTSIMEAAPEAAKAWRLSPWA